MDSKPEIIYSVSEFIATTNQVLDHAFAVVKVEGEVSEFRVSRGRWVYFKLKDEQSSLDIFSSVYQLNLPLEDGMKIQVKGTPRLHNKYGFSLNAISYKLEGEGTIKKSLQLLKRKLEGEGLFEESRKRSLPEFPYHIGVISSLQAAGYKDFLTVLQGRWQHYHVKTADVLVQGESAPPQIVQAIEHFNTYLPETEVLVLIRGGGSAEDLLAFSDERVVRAVAASKIPIMVGVGHEQDISLADLAADRRAATPTDAARIILPNQKDVMNQLVSFSNSLNSGLNEALAELKYKLERELSHLQYQASRLAEQIQERRNSLIEIADKKLENISKTIGNSKQTLVNLDPSRALAVGYSLVRSKQVLINSVKRLKIGDKINVELSDGSLDAEVENVRKNK